MYRAISWFPILSPLSLSRAGTWSWRRTSPTSRWARCQSLCGGLSVARVAVSIEIWDLRMPRLLKHTIPCGWVKKFAIWYCSLSMLYKYNWFKTRSWCWKAMGRHHAMSCLCGIITKIFTLSLWIWIKFAFEPYWTKVLMHQPSGKLKLSSWLSKKRQKFTFFFINHAECTEQAANLTTGVATGFEPTFI